MKLLILGCILFALYLGVKKLFFISDRVDAFYKEMERTRKNRQ
jgi:hypothetical protein